MTDLSISDLTIYWNGFQEEFDDWYHDKYWYTQSYYCQPDRIASFCRSYVRFYDDCKAYCVNDNYCSRYWTKQAKVCCVFCGQTCTSMGESVSGVCRTPIVISTTSTTTTTSRTPSTTKKPTTRTSTRTSTTTTTPTTKKPVTTSTYQATNGTSYTKQPFGKSPIISVPIVAGLIFLFIVVYLLRRRFKSPLNMSTGDRSNDSVFFDQMIQFFFISLRGRNKTYCTFYR